MAGLVFYLVDVFAEEKYAGNQLAVVVNAGSLSSVEMQRIANEMHFSETTFVLSDQKVKGGFDVRIFTPSTELPFAGHPTLGTAHVIKHHLVKEEINHTVLNLKVGQISVTSEKDNEGHEVLWMKQADPVFGKTFDAQQLSMILGLDAKDMDSRFPIQMVSTGLRFLIVPLKTLDAVKRTKVDTAKLIEFARGESFGVLVFCSKTYNKENDLNVRAFANLFGIPEDPATGSGNGCLAAYLSYHSYFGDDRVDARVEQGYEISRPSLLFLKAENKEGKIQVHVGGKVILVASGKLE
jgi:trans-2,3-dihydro-3-hydroxyanthranilate isomerase